MAKYLSIQVKTLSLKFAISVLLIAVVAITFASKGGAKKNKLPNTDFVPVRTTTGFTLKSGPSYGGSHILSQQKSTNSFSFNSVVTYQKGNTIYIMPYKYKVSVPSLNTSGKSNLQFFGVKIKMPK